MKRFFLVTFITYISFFASISLRASEENTCEGLTNKEFFGELFTEIEDAENNESPVSLALIDKAITAVEATHAFFRGKYKPLPKSLFRTFKEDSAAKAISETAAAINSDETNPAAIASSMGISPHSPWAGGGEKNWERSIPDAARVPDFWRTNWDSSGDIGEPEDEMIEWPRIFESKNSYTPSPTSWIRYYFLPKKVRSISPRNSLFLNGGIQTCVILAAGDIHVYDRHGSLRDCVIISSGDVTVSSSSEFLTIIAKGSVKFKSRNTSSVVLAGSEVSSELVDEGAMSFAKAHFLANKVVVKNATDSSSGAYKDHFVKILQNESPFCEVGKIIKNYNPNIAYLEQLAEGQAKYWKVMKELNASKDPILLLAEGLSSEDEQLQDISLELIQNVQPQYITESAVPTLIAGLTLALNNKDAHVQRQAAIIISDNFKIMESCTGPEIQLAISKAAQSQDDLVSWKSLLALDTIGPTSEAIPGLVSIAQSHERSFMRGLAMSALVKAAKKKLEVPEELLLTALNEKDKWVVQHAISALAEIPQYANKAIPALTAIAEGKNAELAEYARFALKKLQND